MPGRVLLADLTVPDLMVPRGRPCEALPGGRPAPCGATPSEPYVKTCPHGHRRPVRLCGTHYGEVITARASCRDCATDRTHPHACPVGVHPLPQP